MATALGVSLLLFVSWMFSGLMVDRWLNGLFHLPLDVLRACFWGHFAWVSASVLWLFNEPEQPAAGKPPSRAVWHRRGLKATWILIGLSVVLAIGSSAVDALGRRTVQRTVEVIGSERGLAPITLDNVDRDVVMHEVNHLVLRDLESGAVLRVHNREPLAAGQTLLRNRGLREEPAPRSPRCCRPTSWQVARVTVREGVFGVNDLMAVDYVGLDTLTPAVRESLLRAHPELERPAWR